MGRVADHPTSFELTLDTPWPQRAGAVLKEHIDLGKAGENFFVRAASTVLFGVLVGQIKYCPNVIRLKLGNAQKVLLSECHDARVPDSSGL